MRAVHLFAVFAAGLSLAGCAKDARPPSGQPEFYHGLTRPGAEVNSAVAASMISGYRRNNGLGSVTVDPALNRIAKQQALAMAAGNRVGHDAGAGNLDARAVRAGYRYERITENVAGGYHTLAEAFSGWRDSPPHKANMLKNGVTKLGIAATYAPGTKYKVFWTLILAST
jgi:uncharacterized protein YkwD